MAYFLRVLRAHILFILGAVVAVIPVLLGYLVTEPDVPRIIGWLLIVTIWILGPAFGGYLAIVGTYRLSKGINVDYVIRAFIVSFVVIMIASGLQISISHEEESVLKILVQLLMVLAGVEVGLRKEESS